MDNEFEVPPEGGPIQPMLSMPSRKIEHVVITEGREGMRFFERDQVAQILDGVFVDASRFGMHSDAHGHVMHGPQEKGGFCGVCGRSLCVQCAQQAPRCVIDQKMLCGIHHRSFEGKFVCSEGHGFFRLVARALFGR